MIRIRPEIEPEMVCIPAGYFWMGSDENDPDAYDDEKPQHQLYLPEFWIGRYPVTVAQFAAFADATGRITKGEAMFFGGWTWRQPRGPGSDLKGKDDHPVIHIAWHDALAYCQWLTEITGRRYTLPSEAEWEKAARGTDRRIYPWGDTWDKNRCNSYEGGKGDTTPVGHYSPHGDSPYKCADMAGNVWERTRSINKPYPYDPNDGREDLITSRVTFRVERGGAFVSDSRLMRCAFRVRPIVAPAAHILRGLRVVVSSS